MTSLHTKRKFLLLTICFSTITFLVYTACKKQEISNFQTNSSFIQTAKDWYATDIVTLEKEKPDTNLQKSGAARKLGQMEKLGKLIKWNEAKLFIAENTDFVVTTINESINPFTNKDYEAARCLVFYKDAAGKIQMKVIEIIGQKNVAIGGNIQEIGKIAFTNSNFEKKHPLNNVNANILVYNKDYQYEKSYHVNAGNWDGGNTRLENTKQPGARPSLSTASQKSEDAGCETHYLVGFHYDASTGEIVDYAILATWAECPNTDNPPSYGGTGGGTTPSKNPLCQITKELAAENLERFYSYSNPEHNIAIKANGYSTTDGTGKILEPRIANWDFYTANFWLQGSATYTMFFSGIRYKNNKTDYWKWQSFEYQNFRLTSGLVPTCWTLTVTPTLSAAAISTDRKKATVGMSFSVQLSVSCAAGWTVGPVKSYPTEYQDFAATD